MNKLKTILGMIVLVVVISSPVFAGHHYIDNGNYMSVVKPGANFTVLVPSNYEVYSSNNGWKASCLNHLTLVGQGYLNETKQYNPLGLDYNGMQYFIFKTEDSDGGAVEGTAHLQINTMNGENHYNYIVNVDVNGPDDKRQGYIGNEDWRDFFDWMNYYICKYLNW